MVTDKLVQDFKDFMVISHNDERVRDMLLRAITYIKSRTGEFKLDDSDNVSILAKDLVFNRARYDYHESTDLFEDNYLSDINHLALLLSGDSDE